MNVVAEKVGNCVNLRLSGRMDSQSVVEFRNACRPWVKAEGVATLMLDFSDVPVMDSVGLGMLLLLREQALAAKKSVVLSHCGPNVQRVLSIAGFGNLFRIE